MDERVVGEPGQDLGEPRRLPGQRDLRRVDARRSPAVISLQ